MAPVFEPLAGDAVASSALLWGLRGRSVCATAPFADRRAEGIFAGISLTSSSYKILNIATGRLILRPFAACVTREPQEVFDYADTIKAAETLFMSNQNPYTGNASIHV